MEETDPDKNRASLPSEDAILACLARHFNYGNPRLALGRGDDCAIIGEGAALCVSSDLFLEDVHFRRSYFTPAELGHKALAVNVSDLAGFGARPVAFNLCLGLPSWVNMPWLEEFFGGMSALARQYRIALAGGDLSCSKTLHISITVFGECLEGCGFLRRGGSMPGDSLFVIGQVGLARVGLMTLETDGRAAIDAWPCACAAHLVPKPQVEAGLMLARAGHNSRPPALMDLSDGILRDLPRLLGQSGELGSHSQNLGANIDLPVGLLHEEVVRHAEQNGKDPVTEAIIGGEDYSLLGSCASDMLPALHAAIPDLHCIGQITGSGEIVCNGQSVAGLKGFDHFEKQ